MLVATASGKLVDLGDMQESDISLADISHHLTKICRYGGALPLGVHYSVASHSLNLCYYAMDNGYNKDVQRWALMHDAAEAYLGDLVTGLKCLLLDYQKIEINFDRLLQNKYGFSVSQDVFDIVKLLDTRILLDETSALIPYYANLYKSQLSGVLPLGINITADNNLAIVRQAFLYTCDALGIKE